MLELSSRSAGIGQKVFEGISSNIMFQKMRWGIKTGWRIPKNTVIHSIYYVTKILTMW